MCAKELLAVQTGPVAHQHVVDDDPCGRRDQRELTAEPPHRDTPPLLGHVHCGQHKHHGARCQSYDLS